MVLRPSLLADLCTATNMGSNGGRLLLSFFSFLLRLKRDSGIQIRVFLLHSDTKLADKAIKGDAKSRGASEGLSSPFFIVQCKAELTSMFVSPSNFGVIQWTFCSGVLVDMLLLKVDLKLKRRRSPVIASRVALISRGDGMFDSGKCSFFNYWNGVRK